MTQDNKTIKKLALFDFDGTITTKDSFIEFLRFTVGNTRFWLGFALTSPLLAAYFARLYSDHKLKERVLSLFFKNQLESDFLEKATTFSLTKIDGFVKQSARDRIRFHKDQNHDIAVVSASCSQWLKPWCDKNKLILISSRMEVINNRISGKLDGLNCKGQEKVDRIKAVFNLDDYQTIYAYGDSSGDKQMLDLAHEAFYRNFK